MRLHKKTAPKGGSQSFKESLLFLKHHMFAKLRVIFHELNALTRVILVLLCVIRKTRSFGGTEFYKDALIVLSHCSSHLLTLLAHVGDNALDTTLIDDLDTFSTHRQLNPTVFAWDVKALGLDVWSKPAICPDV